MFVLSQKDHYTWPVKYEFPTDKGRYEKVEFIAEFKRLPQQRLDEFAKMAKEDRLDDIALIDEVLTGWSGIKTADGQEFEYSEQNRTTLLELAGMRAAIVFSFIGSIGGAPRKN